MKIVSLVLSVTVGWALAAEAPRCLVDRGGEPEISAESILAGAGIVSRERFIRLVFSESLASRCTGTDQEDSVVQGIAWVIRNREQNPKRFGAGATLVTAPNQFRSTFGRYDVARRMEFLCPEKAGDDWRGLWRKAEMNWDYTAGAKNPLPGVYNYLLGEHFRGSDLKVAPPGWAKPPSKRIHPELPGIKQDSQCIQFWKTPKA